jgi:hypothetical protein
MSEWNDLSPAYAMLQLLISWRSLFRSTCKVCQSLQKPNPLYESMVAILAT